MVTWVLVMSLQRVIIVARLKVLRPWTRPWEAVDRLTLIVFIGRPAGSFELTSAAKNTQ